MDIELMMKIWGNPGNFAKLQALPELLSTDRLSSNGSLDRDMDYFLFASLKGKLCKSMR